MIKTKFDYVNGYRTPAPPFSDEFRKKVMAVVAEVRPAFRREMNSGFGYGGDFYEGSRFNSDEYLDRV